MPLIPKCKRMIIRKNQNLPNGTTTQIKNKTFTVSPFSFSFFKFSSKEGKMRQPPDFQKRIPVSIDRINRRYNWPKKYFKGHFKFEKLHFVCSLHFFFFFFSLNKNLKRKKIIWWCKNQEEIFINIYLKKKNIEISSRPLPPVVTIVIWRFDANICSSSRKLFTCKCVNCN